MSNSWPSSPTRGWRKRIGLPIVSQTASAQMASTGSNSTTSTNATSRSSAYLIANCQPLGSLRRDVISGTPPRCSTVRRRVVFSNSRGTRATAIPRSSQRLTRRRRTSLGAVENVTITWPIPYSDAMRSRSQLAPRTGSRRAPFFASRGSLSRKPIGSRPSSGCSSRRFAVVRPIWPAPTIRVGTSDFPCRLVWSCQRFTAIRPAATRAAAKRPSQTVSRAAVPRLRIDQEAQRDDDARRDRERPEGRDEVVEAVELQAPAVASARIRHAEDDRDEQRRPEHPGGDGYIVRPEFSDQDCQEQDGDVDSETDAAPQSLVPPRVLGAIHGRRDRRTAERVDRRRRKVAIGFHDHVFTFDLAAAVADCASRAPTGPVTPLTFALPPLI